MPTKRSPRGLKRKIKEEKENLDVDIKNEVSRYESDDEEMAEYEQKRLQNIADRKNKIDELKITDISLELASEINQQQQNKSKSSYSKRGLSAVPKEKEILPPRKSRRLQNIDADTGLQLPEKEPTHYHIYEDDRPERPPLEDLGLEDLCNNNEDCETTSNYFESKVKPFIDLDTKKNVVPTKSIFDNVATLGKNLKNLKITETQVAKVVPDRIFSLAIHPTETKLLVAAGGKWGALGFWDVQDNESSTHGVQVIKHHSRPINCMTYDAFDSSKLITTSYDGTCRIFDINEKKSSVIFGVPDDDSAYTTYHAQVDRDCFLVTLGKQGIVGLIDRRVSHLKPTSNFKVYDRQSPKVVSVNPSRTNLFLAPSNKGNCGIYDMRKGCKSGVMAPLSELMGHSKAISSAFFSPKTGSRVVTVAYDNKLRLYDTSEDKLTAKILKPYKSISHNNQTGRWLTTFKAEWHPNRDDIFFVGSMNQPRQIDVYSDQGDHFPMSDKGEYLASVCSIVKCHPTQDIVVGGNSSGRVHVFKE